MTIPRSSTRRIWHSESYDVACGSTTDGAPAEQKTGTSGSPTAITTVPSHNAIALVTVNGSGGHFEFEDGLTMTSNATQTITAGTVDQQSSDLLLSPRACAAKTARGQQWRLHQCSTRRGSLRGERREVTAAWRMPAAPIILQFLREMPSNSDRMGHTAGAIFSAR
jgi:hypothetical protein